MKNLIKLSFIGALTMFSATQASYAAEVDTVTVMPNNSQFLTTNRYPMRSIEFFKFKRVYDLSNGMTLTLSSDSAVMYARLNDGPKERIVATSTSSFSSTESKLNMHINIQRDDEASGEVYIPVGSATADLDGAHQQYIVASFK